MYDNQPIAALAWLTRLPAVKPVYSSIVIVSLFESYLVTFGHKLPALLAAFSAKNPCFFSGKILGITSLTISKQIRLNQLNIGGKWQKRLHPFFSGF